MVFFVDFSYCVILFSVDLSSGILSVGVCLEGFYPVGLYPVGFYPVEVCLFGYCSLAGYPALLGPLPLYSTSPSPFVTPFYPPSDYPASPRIFAV